MAPHARRHDGWGRNRRIAKMRTAAPLSLSVHPIALVTYDGCFRQILPLGRFCRDRLRLYIFISACFQRLSG